ncbi:MAG: superinfection immunity protein [Dehalococcoidia bacterium]|nr:superinfection immunity protein [Dehalococcoidia bacterium]
MNFFERIGISGWLFGSVFVIIISIISVVIYFLPTIIAVLRHHRNALAVFLVNLFFGWTFIGWVIALIWSVIR